MTYGYGTHSFLNSTEHRQMKKARAEATKEYESRPVLQVIELPVACTCVYAPFPHLTHKLLEDRHGNFYSDRWRVKWHPPDKEDSPWKRR